MTARTAAICGLILTVTSLEAAAVSKQQADLFSQKLAQIVVQGDAAQKAGTMLYGALEKLSTSRPDRLPHRSRPPARQGISG